jgi:hypothetical protein
MNIYPVLLGMGVVVPVVVFFFFFAEKDTDITAVNLQKSPKKQRNYR